MAKILIVDDERDFRAQIKSVLEAEGFVVLQAADGQSALKAFNDVQPDAVVLDLNMPGMGGMEVFDELKKIDRRVPVIILTGFGDIPGSVDAVKKGVYDFIEKPPDYGQLVSKLRKASEYKKLLCELLSSREEEVLELLRDGQTTKKAALEMRISIDAVNSYLKRAREKLEAKNTLHAIAKAISLGLIKKS